MDYRAIDPSTITRRPDGAAVVFRDTLTGAPEFSGIVVATLKHGKEYLNTPVLDMSPSFMVEAHCSHVTRIRVTDPPSDGRWKVGQEVDVPTMHLVPA